MLLTPPAAAPCSERLMVGKKKINSVMSFVFFSYCSINWDDKVFLEECFVFQVAWSCFTMCSLAAAAILC